MNIEEIAKMMVAKGKGILAADESTGTMEKRLKSVNVECTEKNRLNFRETLFSSNSMKTSISGVILFDETLRQTSSSGISIPELIKKSGADWIRTSDLRSASAMLSQLSYSPGPRPVISILLLRIYNI